VLGAVAQLEKAMLVSKLRGARERKRRETGRCEGNPAWVKTVPQAAIDRARALHEQGLSLRKLSVMLANEGFYNRNGEPYAAQSVKRMLAP
jgi:hypothetical protein